MHLRMASYLNTIRLCTVFALIIGLSPCVGSIQAQEATTPAKKTTTTTKKPATPTKTQPVVKVEKQAKNDKSCSGEITLQGTLEEEISVPACGTFTVGLVMKFKMIDVHTNSYFSCAMVILCPNIYGKGFFKLGKRYRFLCGGQVESSLKRYNEYLIINKYAKLQLRTYVAQKVQMIVE